MPPFSLALSRASQIRFGGNRSYARSVGVSRCFGPGRAYDHACCGYMQHGSAVSWCCEDNGRNAADYRNVSSGEHGYIFESSHFGGMRAACWRRSHSNGILSTVNVRSCGFAGLGRLETRKPITQVRSIMSASRERWLQCVVEVGNDVNQAIFWL
jgi:hypothetical protein